MQVGTAVLPALQFPMLKLAMLQQAVPAYEVRLYFLMVPAPSCPVLPAGP